VLMIGLPASQMKDQEPIFNRYNIGGAVLMTSSSNPNDGGILEFKFQSGAQGIPLLIATDEEGGIVQRFKSLGVLPAPYDVAGQFTIAQAQTMIESHGRKLQSVGVDMVLGPLADVAPVNSESPLGSRVFSDDPEIVGEYDLAYINGWKKAGLLATLKHFPGLGSATANTDYQSATTPPLASLAARDFVPYRALASTGAAVMVGSQNVPDWFSGPAVFSPKALNYLRYKLGYKNNLVITDSLAATAVTDVTSVPDAVVKALKAGNDIALIVLPNINTITPIQNEAIIKDAVSVIKKAISEGIITKKQIAQSVVRKLSAQNLSACSITEKSSS
jgi:beta-N-acetylhexosaminidase